MHKYYFVLKPENKLDQGDWLSAMLKHVGNGGVSANAAHASAAISAAAGETVYDDDDAYEGELAYTYVDHHEVRGLVSSPLQVSVSSFILHSYISIDSAVILH